MIENSKKIERKAQENRKLAQHEYTITEKSKIEAKLDLKKAKIRENLFQIEMEVAKIRTILVEKKKN